MIKERDLVISRLRFLIVIIGDNRQVARDAKLVNKIAKPVLLAILKNSWRSPFLGG
ncbi:MAG: hypothetical protein JW963_12750 [Anaerolineales bacterium]|nr:hypothetical protein [Anaerolineales bacterium]